MAKNTFTTVRGKQANKFPAKKPGVSDDKRKPRKALSPPKKRK